MLYIILILSHCAQRIPYHYLPYFSDTPADAVDGARPRLDLVTV